MRKLCPIGDEVVLAGTLKFESPIAGTESPAAAFPKCERNCGNERGGKWSCRECNGLRWVLGGHSGSRWNGCFGNGVNVCDGLFQYSACSP